MAGLGLLFMRRGIQAHPTAGSSYIKFKDDAVFSILMSKGVSSDGIGISKEDAAKVTTIGTWFSANKTITSFEELRFFTGVISLEQKAFNNCSALASIDISNIVSIGYQALSGIGATEIDARNAVTIADQAFYSNKATSILLENVQSIGYRAFYSATNTDDYVLPNLTSLGGETFRNSKITGINMPNVTVINNGEFQSCTGLTKAIMGDVTSVGELAFYGCSKLQSVVFTATTPPTLKYNCFYKLSCTFYVPDEVVDVYKAATGWTGFASQIKPLSEYNG